MDGPVTSYLYLGLRSGVDWWETLNESKVWQDRFFYGLAGAYALIATIALVQLIRIEIRVPEYGWTTQKVFHLLNFLVNGVRAVVFVFRQQVQFLKPEILQAFLLDLPGLLFFTTYTLLVLFWAEIYHQARSLPTDKLRPTFMGVNTVIYVVQIFIWLGMWWKPVHFLSSVSKIFFAGVSFAAAIGFLLYGGRLFLMLQRFPIESKGRRKKLREVGWVTAICFTCFIIRSAIMAWAAFDKRLDLDVLDHPVLNAAVYFLVEIAPSALVLYILRKLPPKRALPRRYIWMSGDEGDNLGAGGSNNPPSITDLDEVNKVLKQLKHETFTTGEDADAWLKGIEFYFEVKKTPELLKATIADMLLTGPAKIWWDEYKKDNLLVLKQISWDTFKDAFKLHYLPACFKLKQMNKFQNLVQEDTVEGYANKFRALQPYGPTMTGAQLADKFIHGLKPELTLLVGGMTYPSLEEAIRVSKFNEQVQDTIKQDREEAAKRYNREEAAKCWKLARENLSKHSGGPGGNVRPIPARQTIAPAHMSQEERERCRRERLCFFCKETGHIAARCPRK